MLWDIFCRVIDNHGDIGVCWRLSRDLVKRGHQVRLWVDDASALAWMAPEGLSAWPAVTLRAWHEAEDAARIQNLVAGDIVIEAFGCELPAPFVVRMVRPSPPVWINLEYLSAEAYVERCHGLRSPVCSGPGAGLNKWFFYPGFTEATGGLMREADLLDRQRAFTPEVQRQWLASLGVHSQPDDTLVSVFCYADAPLGALLDRWKTTPLRAGATTHVLLTPGHGKAGIDAQVHRRRAGMGLAAGQREFQPPQALTVCDHADLLVFGLEDRALFDVVFEIGVHLPGADLFVAQPADALQLFAEGLALHILAGIGIIERMNAGEDARGEHGGGEAGAFLIYVVMIVMLLLRPHGIIPKRGLA